jgi:NitT/TauT family transport system permease protein
MHATAFGRHVFSRNIAPILALVCGAIVIWYALAVLLNAHQVIELVFRNQPYTLPELIAQTWAMKRPVLPAPHQIAADWFQATFLQAPGSPASLIFHAGVTAGPTLLGFAMGLALGLGLAILIVHSRALERSLLPWIIASQTVPVLAIAPIVIVMLGNLGLSGVMPKAVISMYLCFFPVTVAAAKGLRSPAVFQTELLHTYAASRAQVLWRLRLPASLPMLMPSLRVAIAAGLVGTIVGELPTGAQAGLGARLLNGSYYGNTIQIWSALVMAALLGVTLTGSVALVERLLLKRWMAA